VERSGNSRDAGDEELMQAVARGDLDAFEQVVLRHQHAAWSVAYRFLGDSMEAEDVVQDAFLKLLDAAPRYRPTASFRTYLYRILTRLCIDRTRKKRPVIAEHIPDAADPSPGPIATLMARERDAQIRQVLDGLPSNQKTAIILRHYQGLSYSEIARVMETTVKAVEGLIGRARASLQSRLAVLK
jgi:RNA polymerase sigma-70 factor, ECF subfamily